MPIDFIDPGLEAVAAKVAAGQRLTLEDGLCLYASRDLVGVGQLADSVRRRRHGDRAYFVYNQHLNYTNVCVNHCRFCAFARRQGQPGAFTLTGEQIRDQLRGRLDEPIRELHIVGGIHPEMDLEDHIRILEIVRQIRPQATIKAFTAVEIDHMARQSGLPLEQVFTRLKAAGLEMMPGGGAEILNQRIHAELFPRKIDAARWLEVMETAHRCGLTSNATMLYGHLETPSERVAHLIRLRRLQDRTGGFSAFIPLAFHPENTGLAHLPGTTATDDLKTVAVARLMLDNIDHIKAYWVMIGEKLAQVALHFGADDLDGTVIEEKITHMAGARSAKGLTRGQLEGMISAAGFLPVQRDSFYRPVTSDPPPPKADHGC